MLKPQGNYFLETGPEKQQCLITKLIRNVFIPPIAFVYQKFCLLRTYKTRRISA